MGRVSDGVEEKGAEGTRTDPDLKCHRDRLIGRRVVGEYLGEKSRRPGQGRRGSKGQKRAGAGDVDDGVIVERSR